MLCAAVPGTLIVEALLHLAFIIFNDDYDCKVIRKEKWRFLTTQRKEILVSLFQTKETFRCLKSTCQININVFNVSNQ